MTETITVERYDRGKLLNAVRTDEGYYLVEAYMARPGVLEYRQADGTVRRELVTKDELHRADSLATLARKPVTLEHPKVDGVPVMVSPENVAEFEVGDVDGEVEVEAMGGFVKVRMAVRRQDGIRAIERGLREMSPGYKVDLEMTPGEHPEHGRYDAIQRNRRYNHAAITKAARAGAEIALRADSAIQITPFAEPQPPEPSEEEIMADVKKTVQEEMARRDAEDKVRRLEAENEELKKKLDAMKGKLDAMEKDAESGTEKKGDSLEQRLRWFEQRQDALDVANTLGVKVADGADVPDIQRAVVESHLGEVRQDATDEYLAGVYDHVKVQAKRDTQRQAYGGIENTLAGNRTPPAPRDRRDADDGPTELNAAQADQAFRENLRKRD